LKTRKPCCWKADYNNKPNAKASAQAGAFCISIGYNVVTARLNSR